MTPDIQVGTDPIKDFVRPDHPREGYLVAVSWADIVKHDNWNDVNEESNLDAVTYGILVADNIHYVAVAGTYNFNDGLWADVHIFPRRPPERRSVKDFCKEVL